MRVPDKSEQIGREPRELDADGLVRHEPGGRSSRVGGMKLRLTTVALAAYCSLRRTNAIGEGGPKLRAAILSILLAVLTITSALPEEIELSYDDGDAVAILGQQSGSANAVRFTPPRYPVRITAARVYLQVWSSQCLAQAIWILDDDGEEGRPGTSLFRPVSLTGPQETGWVDFRLPEESQVTIQDGEFYVAYTQQGDLFECTSMMLDLGTDEPERQWHYQGGSWQPAAPLGDFMIRATVETEIVAVERRSWGGVKMQFLDGSP